MSPSFIPFSFETSIISIPASVSTSINWMWHLHRLHRTADAFLANYAQCWTVSNSSDWVLLKGETTTIQLTICNELVWNLRLCENAHVFHDLNSAMASAMIFAKLKVSSILLLRLISTARFDLFVFSSATRLAFILSKYFKNNFVLVCMGFSSRISTRGGSDGRSG